MTWQEFRGQFFVRESPISCYPDSKMLPLLDPRSSGELGDSSINSA